MADWEYSKFGAKNPDGLRRLAAWYGYPWAWCARFDKVCGAIRDVLKGRKRDWIVRHGNKP